MAGPETDAQFHFTGRMNCVLATCRGIALIVLYI
ncbi:unnamed protein product [Nyctereutes procyonoides]|uniref:(raccoon dog) hypothetical protein n=1 Tax=Nyctereutes procyonoides TaxID=34880 RepID=A0A811ZPN2_NYCPR|nr:unnamed protein product [Nyctereutes procyonoides]